MGRSGKNNVQHRSSASLSIIVVGAGIGGLSAAFLLGRAGHKVTVVEAATVLGEVGAGIQLSPNVSRLLIRWGLGERLRNVAVVPSALCLRRYSDGELLGWNSWGKNMEKEYGAPYYHLHRGELHSMLYELAAPYITVRLNSQVVDVDPITPRITLKSGEILSADLIVGADGIASRVRETAFQVTNSVPPAGDSAYRAVINTADMMHDPELKQLVDDAAMNIWMGPRRHIVGYSIRNKKEYNLVMLHPSKNANEPARSVDCAQVKADFIDFEPRIQKILNMEPSTLLWSLTDRRPLDTWVHRSGKVCLLGDACHPMLPYRAQGAAMAVEDAAVLGNLFSKVSSRSEIPFLLQAYQTLRYPRATATQHAARKNQKTFHLNNGPEQQARDSMMRWATEVAHQEARGELVNHSDTIQKVWEDVRGGILSYGYDADLEVEQWRADQEMAVTSRL